MAPAPETTPAPETAADPVAIVGEDGLTTEERRKAKKQRKKARRAAEALAAAGHPTYRYHFRSVPASPKQTAGAYHAAEIFHVFDSSFPLVSDPVDGHLLTRDMGDRWFAFAATHVPDSPGRAQWPRFDPAEPKHMVFDRPVSGPELNPAEPGLALLRDRIDFINQATSKTVLSTSA